MFQLFFNLGTAVNNINRLSVIYAFFPHSSDLFFPSICCFIIKIARTCMLRYFDKSYENKTS